MSEPWRDYAADPVQTDGPWSDYDMTGPNDRAPQRKRKSISLGFMEELGKVAGNAQDATDATLGSLPVVGPAFHSKQFDQDARKGMQNYFTGRERTETPAASGKIAGDIVATVPIMAATKNPWIAGGLMGGATTDAKDPVGIASDVGVGAVTNWFGGKAAEGAARVIAPVIDPAVRRLADAGVEFSPAMLRFGRDPKNPKAAMAREDKRMSKPYVGDAIVAARQGTRDTWNIATVNEALAPLGVKVPSPMKPSPETVEWAHRQVTDAYDRVIPNLALNLNGQQFATKLMPVVSTLPAAQRKEFTRLVSLHLKNGQLQGQALKDAQGEVRRLSSLYGRSQVAADQELGRALGSVDDELSAEMLTQNPRYAPELQKVNSAYRGMMLVEDAAKRADESTFSTGQFRDAVKRGDRTKGQTATAQGNAFMQDWSRASRKVVPAVTPDSGTSSRNQAASLFAKLGGATDLAGFKAEQIMAKIDLLPRPQQAAALADLMRRLARPAGAGAVALTDQASN